MCGTSGEGASHAWLAVRPCCGWSAGPGWRLAFQVRCNGCVTVALTYFPRTATLGRVAVRSQGTSSAVRRRSPARWCASQRWRMTRMFVLVCPCSPRRTSGVWSSRRAAAGQSLQDARSVPPGCPERPARPAPSTQNVADAEVWRGPNKKTGSIREGCCRLNRFRDLARCSEFHRLAAGIFKHRSHQLARLCDLNESLSPGESPAEPDRRELQIPEPAGRASGGSSGRVSHRALVRSAPEHRDTESLAGRG